jgi:hypothetical protein
VHVNGFNPSWRNCAAPSPNWPVQFILAALPLTIRLVQSIRRYFDSKFISHLINAGFPAPHWLSLADAASFLGREVRIRDRQLSFYYIWRHQGSVNAQLPFIAAANRRISRRTWIHWCLFGTVFNICTILGTSCQITCKFETRSGVFYIPQKGPDFMLRTFIAALLEILRRWQWNFCEE